MNCNLFNDNRKRFIAIIGVYFTVLAAYTEIQRNNNVSFAFGQEANLWYLTGIETPDWWLTVDSSFVQMKSATLNPAAPDVTFAANTVGWNGKIDDARLYNRVLSDSEVSSLYSVGAQ